MAEPTLKSVHVDRSEELACFADMISGRGTCHVLLIEAEPGMGKSSLLREFWTASAGLQRSQIDLRSSHSVERVLGELAAQRPEVFAGFFDQLKRPDHTSPVVNISRSTIKESQLGVEGFDRGTARDGEVRRQLLTNAFFSDLIRSNRRSKSVVFIFDTFNEAGPEVQRWLGRLFLIRAMSLRWLTVVVSGQSVPSLGFGAEEWCRARRLRPLEPVHVGEYLQRLNIEVTQDNVVLIHALTDGVPLRISLAALSLLRRRGIGNE